MAQRKVTWVVVNKMLPRLIKVVVGDNVDRKEREGLNLRIRDQNPYVDGEQGGGKWMDCGTSR